MSEIHNKFSRHSATDDESLKYHKNNFPYSKQIEVKYFIGINILSRVSYINLGHFAIYLAFTKVYPGEIEIS